MPASARRRPTRPVLATAAVVALVATALVAVAGCSPGGNATDRGSPQRSGTSGTAEADGTGAADRAVYVALGDSLTSGVGAEPDEGFVPRLAEDVQARTGDAVRVVNLAVPGATAADVLAGQLPQLRQVARDTRPALVTLLVGTNDASAGDPDRFRRDLAVVLDALPPGALVADLPHLGLDGRPAAEALLSAIVRDEVRRRPHLLQVDLARATAGVRPEDVSADGFHPSASGYARFHDAFRAALARSEAAPG